MLVKKLNTLQIEYNNLSRSVDKLERSKMYYDEQINHLEHMIKYTGFDYNNDLNDWIHQKSKATISIVDSKVLMKSLEIEINELKTLREKRLKIIRKVLVVLVLLVAAPIHITAFHILSNIDKDFKTHSDIYSFCSGYIIICITTTGLLIKASEYKKFN